MIKPAFTETGRIGRNWDECGLATQIALHRGDRALQRSAERLSE